VGELMRGFQQLNRVNRLGMAGGGVPRYLLKSRGSYSDFETPWTQILPTVTYDTAFYTHGSRSMKLTASDGAYARAEANLGAPPSKMLQVDVYVDNADNLTRFDLLLCIDNLWNGFLNGADIAPKLPSGQWVTLQYSLYDFYPAGTGMALTDWPNINYARLTVNSKAGTTVNVWVDRLQWVKARPVCTFTWDDGRSGNFTNAMPMLAAHGWKSTVYVVTDAIGKSSYNFAGGSSYTDILSLAQLQGLRDAGWDVGSHTHTHPDLTTLTQAQQLAEMQTSYNWLITNGFSRGAEFFATPYGARNADTVLAAKQVYINLRDASTAGNTGYEPPLLNKLTASTQYGLRYQEINSAPSQTPLATFQGWVDKAIETGTWLIVVGHTVDGPTGWLDPALFAQYLSYLDSKRSEIDVLSMGQYWDMRSRSLGLF
jgi:peptidoglycan/xylan/chitin deacetylase (PgdA/CDA1 family)